MDGQTIQEVTPLWCAAAIGNFCMVKYLIGHRAQVNKSTATRSTPLRAACYSGFLDIIKYLIDNNADISINNKSNYSCLMIASYKGHIDAVHVLLENGASVKTKSCDGSTALHDALDQNHVEIANALINHGSQNCTDNKNMTPLKIAAYNCHEEIVELLIATVHCSKIDKIDAYELLGASLANDTDPEISRKAYSYLRKGMAERFINPLSIVHKCCLDPQHTFENHVECRTLEELDVIKDDNALLDVEALVVRGRILGDHSDVIEHIWYRGALFADNANYNKCMSLWLYALTLRQRKKESASFDLTMFVGVFVELISKDCIKNSFNEVQTVFKSTIDELELDINRIEKSDDSHDYITKYEQNIHTCLYLLVILVKIPKSTTETSMLYSLVSKFVELNPELSNKNTLLHLATDEETKIVDGWQSGIIVFPNDKVTKLLIDCGADINAKNSNGHTPQLDHN